MAHHAFITVTGAKQGEMSKGAGAQDSIGNMTQTGHEDEILVFGFDMHGVVPTDPASGTVVGTRQHMPASFTKPLDKSSPLLWQAFSQGETLTIELHHYRTAVTGQREHYYTVKFTDAVITDVQHSHPDVLDQTNAHRGEWDKYSFSYVKVEFTHEKAGTSSSDSYKDQVTA